MKEKSFNCGNCDKKFTTMRALVLHQVKYCKKIKTVKTAEELNKEVLTAKPGTTTLLKVGDEI